MSGLSIKHIQEELEDILQDSYLQKHLQKPEIDNDKLMILYTLIQNTNYTDIKKKNYVITTMLVQIALDTHDLVTENNIEESDTYKRNRQLTVLAGDYYSGLYYYMLAKLDDIPMIRTLASAIKEINELKMMIYYEVHDSISDLMENIKSLESILVIRVAEHFNRSAINEFAKNWLFTRKLIKEKHLFITDQRAPLVEFLIHGQDFNLTYNQVDQTIESFIYKHLLVSKELVDFLPTHYQMLKNDVHNLYAENYTPNKIAMEEG
ncbi:heptaprenyl diphosphate synthase component 1 [Paraliobacillus zengyii]|uniref:heptaprenyl diphosphate synthase component 1 n=1 Tax=Paraliobacillus zengyii TaxID=2213194 RepID=UPI001E418B75|nr:heptaprenyl diphosphate synthase component 1 [Paraliobacillus zengyii]